MLGGRTSMIFFKTYLGKWHWPGRISSMVNVSDVFKADRAKKHREASIDLVLDSFRENAWHDPFAL